MLLTVVPGVGAADGGYGRPAGHDELVRHTLVVRGLGLGEDHVVQVQPGQGRGGQEGGEGLVATGGQVRSPATTAGQLKGLETTGGQV